MASKRNFRRSLLPYASAVIRYWWAVVIAGIGGLLGAVALIAPSEHKGWLPWVQRHQPIWWIIFVAGLFIAQFLAFHKVRVERDVIQAKAKAGPKLEIVKPTIDAETLTSNGQSLPIDMARVTVANRSKGRTKRVVAKVRAWVSIDGMDGPWIARWTSTPEPRNANEAALLDHQFIRIAPGEEFQLDIALRFPDGKLAVYRNPAYTSGFQHYRFEIPAQNARVEIILRGPRIRPTRAVFRLRTDGHRPTFAAEPTQ